MRPVFTARFVRSYRELPPEVQKKFDKQLSYLLENLRYPSLRAKKYDETRGIWQARVNGDHRFYFQIQGDTYVLLTIHKHPK